MSKVPKCIEIRSYMQSKGYVRFDRNSVKCDKSSTEKNAVLVGVNNPCDGRGPVTSHVTAPHVTNVEIL